MSTSNRVRLVIALIALAALGFVLSEYADNQDRNLPNHEDYRVPVANPPVEPDRPDLFEEPRIDDEPEL